MATLTKKTTSTNVVQQALAGTGKTTTNVWALTKIPDGITLSDEQAAIIEAVRSEKSKTRRFTAFSKRIATELQSRLGSSAEACTNHSLGFSCIRKKAGRTKVDSRKYFRVCESLFGIVNEMTTQKAKSAAIAEYREITALSDIVRSTLTGDISSSQKAGHWIVTPDEVAQTAAMYSINYEKQSSLEQACEVVKAGSKNLNIVDFTDMIAQPACHDLAPDKVDLGLVDEAQDMNTAQQWLATRSADRLVIVGDDNQSIFGWAGADPESMLRLHNQLGETHRGVITLPLTETRRCAKSIVAVAQQFVPQFRAHTSNIEGLVTDCKASDLVDILGKDSSEKVDVAVLCRTNAPLARLGLQLLRAEIPVAVKSGNFAKTIKSIVKKLDCGDITEFRNNLDTYLQIELDKIAKWNSPNADQVRSLIEDRCDTILVLSEGCSTVACISQKIDRLFDDTPDRRKIPLSSVHSAKGLEWDKVIIHKPDLLPHPKISEKNAFNAAQERNLAYVGFTRAKRELIFARDSKEV